MGNRAEIGFKTFEAGRLGHHPDCPDRSPAREGQEMVGAAVPLISLKLNRNPLFLDKHGVSDRVRRRQVAVFDGQPDLDLAHPSDRRTFRAWARSCG